MDAIPNLERVVLISIHIPKTAGTAFGQLLEARFGDMLLRDYADMPLSHSTATRLASACARIPMGPTSVRGYAAVHGHFLPVKYSLVRADFVTWLRDPVQRVVSRYEHYRRDVAEGRALQRVRGLMPGLSLEEFIAIPRFQNTCSKYLWGFPRSRIACYGFSEDMLEGLERMRVRLGLELPAPIVANANPAKLADAYEIPRAIRARIIALNIHDYRLWNWARERESR